MKEKSEDPLEKRLSELEENYKENKKLLTTICEYIIESGIGKRIESIERDLEVLRHFTIHMIRDLAESLGKDEEKYLVDGIKHTEKLLKKIENDKQKLFEQIEEFLKRDKEKDREDK